MVIIMQAKWGDTVRNFTRKRRGKLTHDVLLLQYSAPAHSSLVSMTDATEYGFEILPNPPYSPDMDSSDFYLFPKLKYHSRGTQYGSNEGVIEAINEYLRHQKNASILKV